MSNVAVVIPLYKNQLSLYEEIALKRCFEVLNSYPVIAVKPHTLDISPITKNYPFQQIESFDDSFFSNIQGYNRLMLSGEFYKAFVNYEYLLIYQLDAFVFSDQLSYWCSKNYDYIGAPWLYGRGYPDWFKKTKESIKKWFHITCNYKQPDTDIPTLKQFENTVGNGGFSLRRVKKFYELSVKYKSEIEQYNCRNEHFFNEDVFWSIEVNRKRRNLKIPNYTTALKFSFEGSLERAFRLNRGQLPFGCHAWDLPQHIDFWRPFFKEKGHKI